MAVQVVLEELKEKPALHLKRPPYPNYHAKGSVTKEAAE
jgi:hypothetical protein